MFAATERTFGIELECLMDDSERVAQHLRNNGIEIYCESYNHHTRDHWKIVSDASVGGRSGMRYLEGMEIVSPILLGDEGLSKVRALLSALNTYNGDVKVNSTCGFHLHVAINDLSLKQIKNTVKAQLKYEWVFDSFLPRSRREDNNTYCHSVASRFGDGDNLRSIEETGFALIDSARNMDTVQRLVQQSRFAKLNFQNYTNRGTVEIRHAAGTLDAEKVVNWVELWTRFFTGFADARLRPSKLNHEKSNTDNSNGNLTLDKAIRRLFKHIRTNEGEIARDLRKYYQKRVKELNAADAQRDAAAAARRAQI
tara:strand:- start:406 stop:1338 length:933 start_codon:yes stop_codon:yes gene_type:complete